MFWNAFLLAIREIKRNLLRSFLTSLGIIIGVGSVITMVTLGSGATKKVEEQISSLGTNLLILRVGQHMRGPGGIRETAPSFKMEDVEAIQREVPGLEAVAPVTAQGAQVVYGNRNWGSTVYGTDNNFLEARDWPLSQGRPFLESELRSGSAVCIIGQTVKRELFGEEDPLSKVIRIKKVAFEVVGLLSSKGEGSFGHDQDNLILIPVRTFHRRMAGNTDISRVDISVLDGLNGDWVKSNIESLMRERRRIRPGEPDNFELRDLKEISETLSQSTRVLTSLLGAVAAVSLFVGGIGIMNIMLVSVTERTREIGTRMAIGALERDVLLQFLVEAVVLSSFGGVLGVLFSLMGSWYLSKAMMVPFVVNPGIILLAFGFSALIGVGFGYFPARKAARLNPIEALRYE